MKYVLYLLLLFVACSFQAAGEEERAKARAAYWESLQTDDEALKEEALSNLIRAIEQHPEDWLDAVSLSHEYLTLGTIRYRLGKYGEAERDFLRGLDLAKGIREPGDSQYATHRVESLEKAYRGLAFFYLAVGDLK